MSQRATGSGETSVNAERLERQVSGAVAQRVLERVDHQAVESLSWAAGFSWMAALLAVIAMETSGVVQWLASAGAWVTRGPHFCPRFSAPVKLVKERHSVPIQR
jgi:hypothetical protein